MMLAQSEIEADVMDMMNIDSGIGKAVAILQKYPELAPVLEFYDLEVSSSGRLKEVFDFKAYSQSYKNRDVNIKFGFTVKFKKGD